MQNTFKSFLVLTIIMVIAMLLISCGGPSVTSLEIEKASTYTDFTVQASEFTRDPQTREWVVSKILPEINAAFQKSDGGVIVFRLRAHDWRVLPETVDSITIGYTVTGNTLILKVLSSTGTPLDSVPDVVSGSYRMLSL